MQANTTEGNESYPYDSESTVPVTREEFEQLKESHEQLKEEHEQLHQDHEQLKDEHEQLKEEIDNEKESRQQEIEGCHNRISRIEADTDGETPTPEAGETTIQQDELTPIEQLSRSEDIEEVTDSPTVKRAVSLFSNLKQWSSKTPKGYVLKPSDNPLKLLEADTGESLCWKQYYRAAETLEQLSHGSVTFFDSDRHGKMLCLHEQSQTYERVVNGTLTESSVGATS